MSKAAGTIGLASLGAAATAGAVYLSKSSTFDSTLPEKLEDFEKDNQVEGCVKSLFPGLESVKTSDKVDTNNKVESTFFETANQNGAEGCLVINWSKETYTDNKWKGKFRFLWVVSDMKSKGFVVFALGESSSAGKKFTWKGAAYTLENDDKNKKWKVARKLEVDSNGKEVEYKDKFPKFKKDNTADWGFGDENGDSMCENGGCTTKKDEEPEKFEGYWTWKGEANGKAKLGEWSDNLDAWWKEVFKEDNWKMSDVVKDMKGAWSEKVWYGKNKPS